MNVGIETLITGKVKDADSFLEPQKECDPENTLIWAP